MSGSRRYGGLDIGCAGEVAAIYRLYRIWRICLEYRFFLIALLIQDLLFGFLLWLLDAKGFWVIVGIFAAASVLLFGGVIAFLVHRENRRQMLVMDYLEERKKGQSGGLPERLPLREEELLQEISIQLQERKTAWQTERLHREDYEGYVETWVHEIKVPISLMALLLDNRKEEMSPLLYQRMVYVKSQISEYVTQILYYARLKADHRDYYFERISLRQCCEEILEQYEAVLAEGEIQVCMDVEDLRVVSDQKGLLFILEQIVGNACKYQDDAKSDKRLEFRGGMTGEQDRICLCISDNGIGVKPADLPFIFDKGFTGDTDERKRKATGMGLYLAKQMADNLNIEMTAVSEYGQGMEMQLEFPVVEE